MKEVAELAAWETRMAKAAEPVSCADSQRLLRSGWPAGPGGFRCPSLARAFKGRAPPSPRRLADV